MKLERDYSGFRNPEPFKKAYALLDAESVPTDLLEQLEAIGNELADEGDLSMFGCLEEAAYVKYHDAHPQGVR